jgi:hypothetical protein
MNSPTRIASDIGAAQIGCPNFTRRHMCGPHFCSMKITEDVEA